MDIRLQTGLIVKNEAGYLVGYCEITDKFTWSDSPWDAWRTRVRAKARSVAEKTGCEIYLFNPVAGQIRKWRACDG
jgi:hypothetical protein